MVGAPPGELGPFRSPARVVRAGPSSAAAREFAAALDSGLVRTSQAVVPGDESEERSRHGDPLPNFERWLLERYCFDARGRAVPAMVDALDRWSLDRLEQVRGLGVEAADRAAAWADFSQARAEARQRALENAGVVRPASPAEVARFTRR